MSDRKLILVIGASGAQGRAVITELLKPAADGSSSPWTVRAFTRNPGSEKIQQLVALGNVEIATGSFTDLRSVFAAMKGVYGAWVNTDGFTVSQANEIFAGIRIYEIAMELKLKHFIWSGTPYASKIANWDPKYQCEHMNAKARVTEFLQSQPSGLGEETTWSALTFGTYMDMISHLMLGPVNVREDGTYVFASPFGPEPVLLTALADVGYFVRYTLEHREEMSGRNLHISSEPIAWPDMVETFKRLTGKKAVYKQLTVDEWFETITNTDKPVAIENKDEGATIWIDNFRAWWLWWRDSKALWTEVLQNHEDGTLKRMNPGLRNFESWMRETGWTGDINWDLLKRSEDGISPNFEVRKKM